MSYLLDTCIVSEFFKKQPDNNVVEWFDRQIPETMFLSVLTIGELRKGLLRLPRSRKRDAVAEWIERAELRYDRRILSLGLRTAEVWAQIRAETENAGTPIGMIDSLIAASALEHDLTVVTRNVRDFEKCGVSVINPW